MSADTELLVRPTGDPDGADYHLVHTTATPSPISTTIVLAISSLTGLEPTGMRPLNDAVDADVLERHVGSSRDRAAVLSFEFHGYRVEVRGDGHVELTAIEAPEPAVEP